MTDKARLKWDHTSSPLAKRKSKLTEKKNDGTITLSEKIELNKLNIEYFKDVIRINKADKEFANLILDEMMKIEKKNKALIKQLSLEKVKPKRQRVFKLRKGPRR